MVRAVRFSGWQDTYEGDRLVQQALRKTLCIKFKIRDNAVFTRALDYIREYYQGMPSIEELVTTRLVVAGVIWRGDNQ